MRIHPLPLTAAAVLFPALLSAQATRGSAPEIVAAPDTRLPLKHTPEPTTAEITANDLMTRLYIFADDSMQGREAGTIGNVKGTDYIAHEVQRLGLRPAGDSGTYFQTIPLKTHFVDSTSTFAAGGAPLAFGTDWAALGTGDVAQSSLPVVFGGTIGEDTPLIAPDQAAGKLVVFALPNGPQAMAALRFMGRVPQTPAASAIVVPDRLMAYVRVPSTSLDEGGDQPQRRTMLFLSFPGAAKLFDKPVEQLAPGATGKTASLDVRMRVDPVKYPARNVVAILPGSDPKLAGEYVAIGAHNDHVGFDHTPVDHDSLRIFNHIVRPGGAEQAAAQATSEQQREVNNELAAWRAAHPGTQRADSIFNGADDDGSGSVSVLEIAEKLASLQPRPRRSILFVWHVGEEKGLLGSEYFTDRPTVPRDSIVGQLNMDMVGRGDAWDATGETKDGAVLHGNPDYLQLVGSRRLSTEMGDLIEKVNRDDHHGLVLDYSMDANGHPMNIYCRSDHYEYARYGIPITFFTTGGHSDYHQVTDEPEYIDYQHMARVDRLVEDAALHIANLDHRLVVDHPKPDPHGSCQQ